MKICFPFAFCPSRAIMFLIAEVNDAFHPTRQTFRMLLPSVINTRSIGLIYFLIFPILPRFPHLQRNSRLMANYRITMKLLEMMTCYCTNRMNYYSLKSTCRSFYHHLLLFIAYCLLIIVIAFAGAFWLSLVLLCQKVSSFDIKISNLFFFSLAQIS